MRLEKRTYPDCLICGGAKDNMGHFLDKTEKITDGDQRVSENAFMSSKHAQDILALLADRGPEKSICPSEVLSFKEKTNPALMEEVREAARMLVKLEKIVMTQKGKAIDPDQIKGPIRLKLKP